MFTKDFMKGICGRPKPEEMRDCGFNWIRTGIEFPYEKDGSFSEIYLRSKEKLKKYKQNGIKTMVITPNPEAFEEYGIRVATKEGLKQVEQIIASVAEDLKGLVDGWQIANEMNVYFFRSPLYFDESIEFIAAGLKGVRSVDQDVLLGFNTSEFSESSEYMTKKLLKHKELFNYMGYDGYYGTWIKGNTDDYIKTIEYIYKLTGKPVIMQEFGFASSGDIIKPGEFESYLKQYGYSNFEEAAADFDTLVKKLPKRIAEMVRSTPYEDDWELRLINIKPHLLQKWVGSLDGTPHTLQMQAQFYDELLPKLARCEYLMGAFIFSWRDSGRCFFCLEEDCPCETAWGINDSNGNLKPAYYVVKKYFKG